MILLYCFQLLWIQYGLRSLPKTDPLYRKVSWYGNSDMMTSLDTIVAQYRACTILERCNMVHPVIPTPLQYYWRTWSTISCWYLSRIERQKFTELLITSTPLHHVCAYYVRLYSWNKCKEFCTIKIEFDNCITINEVRVAAYVCYIPPMTSQEEYGGRQFCYKAKDDEGKGSLLRDTASHTH